MAKVMVHKVVLEPERPLADSGSLWRKSCLLFRVSGVLLSLAHHPDSSRNNRASHWIFILGLLQSLCYLVVFHLYRILETPGKRTGALVGG